MLTAQVIVDPEFRVGPVRRETFGAFVEHLGRCVYSGIFEPGHPAADMAGFRTDVLDLVRALGISSVRYPGGNFVSGYRWEDGVGPVERRPRRLDLAWHSTEPNTFGLDEFVGWTRAAGVRPMMAVNLGTRGVQEALDLLEYCNIASGTRLSDLRVANGAKEPHDIRTWCLGNEMDGPWQTGHKTALEYGRSAAETARAMRQLDPDLTLVACGSSGRDMPTFGTWEATVLSEAYDHVDWVSAHAYFCERNGDLASFLASGVALDRHITDVVASVDHVRAVRKSSKRLDISFDEWNVWYSDAPASVPPSQAWPIAPALLEDRYNVADAVVVGGLLITLLRRTDRVASASLAQLVNVIAPIMTEPGGPAWKQTTYHPFMQASTFAAGMVLNTPVTSSAVVTAAFDEVPAVDVAVTYDDADGAMTVFAVNRSIGAPVALTVRLRPSFRMEVVEATVLSAADPHRTVDARTANDIAPRRNPEVRRDGTDLIVELPPVSWNVVRLNRSPL